MHEKSYFLVEAVTIPGPEKRLVLSHTYDEAVRMCVEDLAPGYTVRRVTARFVCEESRLLGKEVTN